MPFDAACTTIPRKASITAINAQILRDARALIARGWLKRAYYRRNKAGQRQYCAVAAIATAIGMDNHGCGQLSEHAELLVREVLREFPRVIVSFTAKGRLMRLNDSPRITKAMMLAGFDRAIARLEAATS